MNINELRDKRAGLIYEARAILDGATGTLAGDDEARYDALFNEAQEIGKQIERAEKLAEAERQLGESAGRQTRSGKPGDDAAAHLPELQSRSLKKAAEAIRTAPEWARVRKTAAPEYRQQFNAWLRGERRALQADIDSAGGYLQLPLQMVDALIKEIDNMVFMRQLATVYTVVGAESLGVPTLENDPADADWTGEITAVSLDTTMSFGRRDLTPQFLTKGIKVSRKLLMRVPGTENLVNERMGYKFGVTMEKAYMTGSGAGQPLGVFTASAQGISTGRDVSTDNTTTAMTADGLRNAKYALNEGYRANAAWIFHRDGVKQISKLKDGAGQYLWSEALRAGEPDTLLGLPIYESEYAPNTFTTGQYVGLLGDMSYYWIADALAQMEMQRLVEKYADTNQVGFYGRAYSDGMPVLEEAFARVKLA